MDCKSSEVGAKLSNRTYFWPGSASTMAKKLGANRMNKNTEARGNLFRDLMAAVIDLEVDMILAFSITLQNCNRKLVPASIHVHFSAVKRFLNDCVVVRAMISSVALKDVSC